MKSDNQQLQETLCFFRTRQNPTDMKFKFALFGEYAFCELMNSAVTLQPTQVSEIIVLSQRAAGGINPAVLNERFMKENSPVRLESELHKDCFVVVALHKGFAPRRAAAMTSSHLTASLCAADKEGRRGQARNDSVPWHQVSHLNLYTLTWILSRKDLWNPPPSHSAVN